MEAIGWAKEIGAYGEKLGGPKTLVTLDIGGDPSTIRWFADYESLDQFEKFGDKLMADAGYFEFLKKAAELFRAGNVNDQISCEI